MKVNEIITELVMKHLDLEESDLAEGQTLQEMGGDALDILEMQIELEGQLNITIGDDEAENLPGMNVEQLIELARRLGANDTETEQKGK